MSGGNKGNNIRVSVHCNEWAGVDFLVLTNRVYKRRLQMVGESTVSYICNFSVNLEFS